MKLVELTPKNKEAFMECLEDPERPVIILFYAEWCPHCQMMKPEWEKATEALKMKRNIRTAQVEHANMKKLPAKYKKNVAGFPSIKKYKGGKLVSEFYGQRTADEILKWGTE